MKKLNLVCDSRDVDSKGETIPDVNINCLLARDCATIISSLREVIIKLEEEMKDHYEKELDLVDAGELARRIKNEY